MKRDKFLDNKVKEVINEGSEIEYLDSIFCMFASECGVEGKIRKEAYEMFVNEFSNMCGNLMNSGVDEYDAKHYALYDLSQKYLPGNNLKKPSHFY